MRLLLYATDVPWGSDVDVAVEGWLVDLHAGARPGEPMRPVIRLELLAEGRTAVDVAAGMLDWEDRDWTTYAPTGCDERSLLMRRYVFDAVPPAVALPYFQPDPPRLDLRRPA